MQVAVILITDKAARSRLEAVSLSTLAYWLKVGFELISPDSCPCHLDTSALACFGNPADWAAGQLLLQFKKKDGNKTGQSLGLACVAAGFDL